MCDSFAQSEFLKYDLDSLLIENLLPVLYTHFLLLLIGLSPFDAQKSSPERFRIVMQIGMFKKKKCSGAM